MSDEKRGLTIVSAEVLEPNDEGMIDITPLEGFDHENTVIEVARLEDGRALVAHRKETE